MCGAIPCALRFLCCISSFPVYWLPSDLPFIFYFVTVVITLTFKFLHVSNLHYKCKQCRMFGSSSITEVLND
jgi:hypothetical protein